jgi:putative acetyltransferase
MIHNNVDIVTALDYEELISVWEAAVRATHHFLQESHIDFYRRQIPAHYFPEVSLFCIRSAEGTIAGFLGISLDCIEMLFVHPDYFGTGVGKRLVNFAVKHKAIGKVDVNEQNPQAVGFYKHMGFVTQSRSENDAEGNPFPVLHMKLETHNHEI